jgi:gliding motility-associated-like protein
MKNRVFLIVCFWLFIFIELSFAQNYCTPAYTNLCSQSGNQTNDVIHSFSTTLGITNISNLNSGCSSQCPGNLTIYPPSTGMYLTVARGQTFRVTVAGEPTSPAGTFQQGYRVWVDWNRNGNFANAGETVYSSPVGFGPFTSPLITVPQTALCGPTRLRVRAQFAAVPNDPCSGYTYGEAEDYTVYIVSNPEVPMPIVPDTSLCKGDNITLSASNIVGDVEWYSGINGTTAISTGPTFTLNGLLNDTVIYAQNVLNTCASERRSVNIRVGFKRENMIIPDTVEICQPDTVDIVAHIAPDPNDLVSKTFRKVLTTACQRIISDDYIGHPGSFFHLPIQVAGINPDNISPADMVLEEVGVRINHTRPKELDIWLIAPNNSMIDLSSDNGANTGTGYGTGTVAASYVYCRFRSEAFLPLVSTATGANISGDYRPEQPFTNLTGPNNGIWRIRVGDDAATTQGNFFAGYLKFRTKPADSTHAWTPVYYIFDSIFTPDSFTVKVSPPIDTTYYITFSDQPGCISKDSIRIQAGTPPNITFTSVPDSVCLGQTINVTANGADSTVWNPISASGFPNLTFQNDSVVNITPANLTDNSYQVIGFSPSGCRDTVQYTPIVNPVPAAPTITASGATTFCSGNTVTLNCSSGIEYLWSNGETTQSITISTAGNYSVQITNASGCLSLPSATTTVVVNPGPGIPAITGAPLTFCQGSSVNLSAPAGFSYLWSTGQTTQNITVSTTQNISVTISDANGCSVPSTSVSVVSNPLPAAPIITPSGPLAFCNGGSVSLSAPTGFTYLWSTGEITQTINLTSSSAITLVVTDANNCSSPVSATTNITVNPIPTTPTISTTGGINTICDGQNLSLSSSNAVSYLWSSGQTTPSISVNINGNYFVTITDANGCTSLPSNPFNVTVNPLPSTPIILANGATTFCDGGNVILEAPLSNSYLWSNGSTSQSITVSNSGTFNVIITDVNGCTSAASLNEAVTVNPNPTVTISSAGPLSFCNGGSVVLSPNLTSNSYLWSPNGETTQTIAASTSGNYSLQVTDINGCTSTPSNTIVVNVFPTPNPPTIYSTTPVICQGGYVTLSTDPANSYSWSNGANTSTITTNTPGTYTLTTIDLNNCASPSSNPINLVINPLPPTPVITTSGSLVFCEGSNVTISGPANYSYVWNGGIYNTENLIVDTNGVFILQVVDANGCLSLASVPVVVTVHPNPEPPIIESIGLSSFCNGGSVELTTNNINVTYLWSTSETTQNITATESGSYSLIITDLFGCTSIPSQIFSVTEFPIPPAPVITATGPSTVCDGETINLVSSFGASYLWNNGETTQSITVNDEGPYSVSLVDFFGCPSPSSNPFINTILTLPARPTISADGPLTFCIGNSVTLSSSEPIGNRWNTGALTQQITTNTNGEYFVQIQGSNGCFSLPSDTLTVFVNPTPPLPSISADGPLTFCKGGKVTLSVLDGQSYLWNNGDTAQFLEIDTTFLVSVSVIDICGVSHLLQASITQLQKPNINFSTDDTLGCAPLNANFVSTTTNSINLIWDFGDGNGNNSNVANPINEYENSGEFSVTLFAVATNGCSAKLTKPMLVKALRNPEADFEMSPTEVKMSNPEVQFTDLSSNDVQRWRWFFGSRDSSNFQHPSYSYQDTGNFKVWMVVYNDLGCTDTARNEVRVVGDLIMYAPNAFTPNGDGINDVFAPKGTYIDPKKYNLKIFNRWGELVFETIDINKGWDGAVGIENLRITGNYHWQLEVTDKSGESHQLKGVVSLLY